MKKKGIIIVVVVLIIAVICALVYYKKSTSLPTPELSEGLRGEFGIDANLNESSIDKYLNRDDTVYRDLRLIDDPADYEAIGGDHYLSGFVDGFEVVPYPYIATLDGLPEEVGEGYTGKSLFTLNEDGTYSANYEESMTILEDLFPKDKYIILMCGGGGYSGMAKNFLISLGWDGDKIYNAGGYWYYDGENNVQVKNDDGTFSLWKIPYHDIDFDLLTEIK